MGPGRRLGYSNTTEAESKVYYKAELTVILSEREPKNQNIVPKMNY